MNAKLLEFKSLILRSGLFVKKTGGWYRGTNCPICGDTKRHYYIHMDFDEDSPVIQKCFKCNAKGVVDSSFLECYGITWDGNIPSGKFNKRLYGKNGDFKKFEIKDDDIDKEYALRCIRYIESRIGIGGLTIDDLKMFNVILNPRIFANVVLGVNDVNYDRCWFMCTNGMMIGRDFVKKRDGWEKFKGKSNNTDRMLYTIKKPFDMYEDINVCICEGIMDCIGLMYHGGIKNGVYIAVLGRDYMAGVEYIINRGFFGDSVCIRIYKDADVKHVQIDKELCNWFKSVDVYMNTLGKDFGLTEDEIEIEKIDSYIPQY